MEFFFGWSYSDLIFCVLAVAAVGSAMDNVSAGFFSSSSSLLPLVEVVKLPPRLVDQRV